MIFPWDIFLPMICPSHEISRRPATLRRYLDRGIPYRRGYLLHGPPGCGKPEGPFAHLPKMCHDVPTIWDLVNHFSWGSLWGVNHPIKHTKNYGKDGGFQLVMGIPKSLDGWFIRENPKITWMIGVPPWIGNLHWWKISMDKPLNGILPGLTNKVMNHLKKSEMIRHL